MMVTVRCALGSALFDVSDSACDKLETTARQTQTRRRSSVTGRLQTVTGAAVPVTVTVNLTVNVSQLARPTMSKLMVLNKAELEIKCRCHEIL